MIHPESRQLHARVMVWDAEEGFGDHRAPHLVDRIVQDNPEVAVITHAVAQGHSLCPETAEAFRDNGYKVVSAPGYWPSGRRSGAANKMPLVVMGRHIEHRTYPSAALLAGQAALLVHLPGPAIDFLAMQLADDPVGRREQAEAVISSLPHDDTVVALGGNILRLAGRTRKFSGAFRAAARHVPAVGAAWEAGWTPARLNRTDARTMGLWRGAGFASNGGFTPVALPSGEPVVQLGGIFARGETTVPKPVIGQNYFLTQSRPVTA